MDGVNEPTPGIGLNAIDRTDPTPLHEQVAAAIRRAIQQHEAGPGDRIPQARDLAAVLGVNKNTVLRALHLLRDEGVLEIGRGRAIRITGTPEHAALIDKTRELIELARHQGYRRDEFIALVSRISET
jgi:GntR family transcriptional regulator